MNFQPVVPLDGLAGWEFLKRTRARQEAIFAKSPSIERTTQGFRDDFNTLRTAQDLTNNRQVLDVVLGAYGLQADLDNRAFIAKIISDGTEDRGAIANRLSDKRYFALARDLAHLASDGNGVSPKGLADQLVGRYRTTEFEVAVGNADDTMRLAMTFERKLPEIAQGSRSDAARWFTVLGDPPTRRVFETALGLPREFGGLDIDEQVSRMKESASKRFGSDDIAQLAEPEIVEKMTRRFLLMEQLQSSQSGMSGAAVALSLLSGAT